MFKQQPTERLIRLPEVMALTGLARPTIYRHMAAAPTNGSRFPRQVKLGRASAWPASEVHHWVEARKADRNSS